MAWGGLMVLNGMHAASFLKRVWGPDRTGEYVAAYSPVTCLTESLRDHSRKRGHRQTNYRTRTTVCLTSQKRCFVQC